MWRSAAIAACLLAAVTAPSYAQDQIDVPAALAGRWEGRTDIRGSTYPPQRILIIKNVRQAGTGTQWKADGLFGVTADRLGPVDVTITVVHSSVTVEFLTPNSLHATLKLVKADILEGSNVVSGGVSARIRLDRKQ